MSTPEPIITERAGLWGARMLCFDSLDSTNSWAVRHPSACQHGDVIRAHDQTAGRGRFEREWLSSPGESLTLSFVVDSTLFPFIARENYAQIAAVAAWQILSGMEIQAKLKWPNDIMTARGKICGILAETITDAKVVIGIGINATLSGNESVRLTSIHTEKNIAPCLDELTGKLIACLASAFTDCRDSGIENLRTIWAAHDYLAGKEITLTATNGPINGTYVGINSDGCLLLNIDSEVKTFHSGDVTLS